MTDVNDLGPDPGTDDAALFQNVTENPVDQTVIEPPAPPKPDAPAPQPEANIPAARLREEADARRAAERDRDDYRRRLDDFLGRQPPPKPEPIKRSDMFEAPSAFVQEEVKPLLDPVSARINQVTEHYSLQNAVRDHGTEKVGAARTALQSAMGARDSEAWGVYNRAMSSIDPYGEIMNWHVGKEVLSTVGSDLGAYRTKVLDEALKDPEFLKRANEAMRGQASATGNNVSRTVPKVPSIGKVGTSTSAADSAEENMSDEELFREATRRR